MTRNIPFAPRSASPLTRFTRTEAGSATVEFVIVFPIIILMLLMGFEASYYMLRTVMLDRATDPPHATCASRTARSRTSPRSNTKSVRRRWSSPIAPSCCRSSLRPVPVVSGGTGVLDDRPRCVDVFDTESAGNDVFLTGAGNQLMALRVCAISDPLFPTSVLASLAGRGCGRELRRHHPVELGQRARRQHRRRARGRCRFDLRRRTAAAAG
ncbi:MAG: pilus assembly protein [Paracoccaceae bacterium]